jgi:YfiH family protein
MQTNGFYLRIQAGIPHYACAAMERDHGLRHGFSTRRGGVSFAPENALNLGFIPSDAPENVSENRRRFLTALDIRPDFLATLAQTHSRDFHIIITGADQWNPHTQGDALITKRKEVALAVKTADCFPVLLSDPDTGGIAAIHAGWRGTLAGIVRHTVEGMSSAFGSRPGRLVAAIGPGIRGCCLEVGLEVDSLFKGAFPGIRFSAPHAEHAGKWLLDLPLILKHQLSGVGVPVANVFDLGLCTRCHADEFFSYRAQGSGAGRLMAVICRLA